MSHPNTSVKRDCEWGPGSYGRKV